jgi:hypothetical protein
VSHERVYVVTARFGEPTRVVEVDPRSGATTPVKTIPRSLPCGESALAVSPDGRHLLYAGVEETSDLVLIGQ